MNYRARTQAQDERLRLPWVELGVRGRQLHTLTFPLQQPAVQKKNQTTRLMRLAVCISQRASACFRQSMYLTNVRMITAGKSDSPNLGSTFK